MPLIIVVALVNCSAGCCSCIIVAAVVDTTLIDCVIGVVIAAYCALREKCHNHTTIHSSKQHPTNNS